jgi:hypothetical protein
MDDAILETLAYSDVFDYPLRLDELHRYLSLSVSVEELHRALEDPDKRIGTQNGFYFLAGRQSLVGVRQKRNETSRGALQRAAHYGRILGRLPFIRMVGLTGSLAVANCDDAADLDYMLVAAHGRVWTARAFALLFGRATAIFGHTLCPNLIISEQVLEWPQRDLYSARELCQMVPIFGGEVYSRLRQANAWIKALLPNAGDAPGSNSIPSVHFLWRASVEFPLRQSLWDPLEAWEMERKTRRFTSQRGYGVETVFNETTCQGNFDHHGTQTRDAYRHRLRMLGLG